MTYPFISARGRDQNLFTVFDNFFKCLAYDESQWSTTAKPSSYPPFGDLNTVWRIEDWNRDQVDPNAYEACRFYAFWRHFNTEKTFEWVVGYTYIPGTLSSKEEKWADILLTWITF